MQHCLKNEEESQHIDELRNKIEELNGVLLVNNNLKGIIQHHHQHTS